MKRVVNGRPSVSAKADILANISSFSASEVEDFAPNALLPMEEVVEVIGSFGPWDLGWTDRGRYLVSRFLFEGHQVCYAHDLHIFFDRASAMRFLFYQKAAHRFNMLT